MWRGSVGVRLGFGWGSVGVRLGFGWGSVGVFFTGGKVMTVYKIPSAMPFVIIIVS
jgi:hypothetical protein